MFKNFTLFMISFVLHNTCIYLFASENKTSVPHNKKCYTWTLTMQSRVNDFLPLQLDFFVSEYHTLSLSLSKALYLN